MATRRPGPRAGGGHGHRPARHPLGLTGAAAPARRLSPATVAVACVLVALVSLVWRTSLAFDPWAWLVWGREVTRFDLSTTGGPSWKPLPVLLTTPLAGLGSAAPVAWLVVARAAGLGALALAFGLGRRLNGVVAGVLATVGLLLTPDGGPRFLRLVAEGHSAPAEAAIALWAAGNHLAGRHRHTLFAIGLLALLRPEAWPFLGLHALWTWRHAPEDRRLLVAVLVAIPVLWFGGDWWGAGNPLHGAGDAQVVGDPLSQRVGESLDRIAKVIVVPLWIGVAVALVDARRRADDLGRRLLTVGLAALTWLGIVFAMAVVLRYAALSRFLLPAAAVLCVLGAHGLVVAVRRASAGLARGGVVAGLVVLSLGLVLPRVLAMGTLVGDIEERADIERHLVEALDDAGGRDVLLACDRVVADPTDLPQAAVAWHLDVPIITISRRTPAEPHVAVLGVGGRLAQRLEASGADLTTLTTNDHWTVVAVDCPAAATQPG